ncbi:MAG: hypothetical protein AB2693_32355, partial [Candidatus Thiodiazotropha sp.]
MRVFGLPELIDENSENIRQNEVENVLKVACPSVEWEKDDIKRAFRVGEGKNDQPPVMIVRFRYDDDKPKVFSGRDQLRACGIRVSDDLTTRQREQLNALRLKGQRGYFYRGKLVVNSAKPLDNNGRDNVKSRVFRTAARRMNPVDNFEFRDLIDQSDENMMVDNTVEISASITNDTLVADSDNEFPFYEATDNENAISVDK